jgi:hypothetical protein
MKHQNPKEDGMLKWHLKCKLAKGETQVHLGWFPFSSISFGTPDQTI